MCKGQSFFFLQLATPHGDILHQGERSGVMIVDGGLELGALLHLVSVVISAGAKWALSPREMNVAMLSPVVELRFKWFV